MLHLKQPLLGCVGGIKSLDVAHVCNTCSSAIAGFIIRRAALEVSPKKEGGGAAYSL